MSRDWSLRRSSGAPVSPSHFPSQIDRSRHSGNAWEPTGFRQPALGLPRSSSLALERTASRLPGVNVLGSGRSSWEITGSRPSGMGLPTSISSSPRMPEAVRHCAPNSHTFQLYRHGDGEPRVRERDNLGVLLTAICCDQPTFSNLCRSRCLRPSTAVTSTSPREPSQLALDSISRLSHSG